MEDIVYQRLNQFLKTVRISRSKAEIQANLSRGYLSHVKKLSNKMVGRILKAFPELNPSWLLTGEGEMLLRNGVTTQTIIGDGNQQVGSGSLVVSDEDKQIIFRLLDENKRLNERIDSLLALLNKEEEE